ncbi:MAG: M48 family metallopeptidase [Proteobacteria bacterium]|nr:MAG: M48 family metallopeptidase [Pseudomonadota bacterium]
MRPRISGILILASKPIPKVAGRFWDGKSSKAASAELSSVGDCFLVEAGSDSRSYQQAKARVAPKLGRLARSIDFEDGSRFESDDSAGFEVLVGGRNFIAWLEASWRAALTGAALLVAFLAISYFVGLPLFSRGLANHVPQLWKKELAQQTKRLLETRYFTASELNREEMERAHSVISKVKAAEPGIEIFLKKSELLGSNALALPDGTIFLTDELFYLARTDEELIGVLLHEAAHVRYNHSMAELISSSAIALVLFSVAGADWTSLPLALLGSSYSRDFEEEADLHAAKSLRAMKLSATALANILERMEAEHEEGKYAKYLALLSSHPATRARAEKLRAFDQAGREKK